jgi:hypothetical protein
MWVDSAVGKGACLCGAGVPAPDVHLVLLPVPERRNIGREAIRYGMCAPTTTSSASHGRCQRTTAQLGSLGRNVYSIGARSGGGRFFRSPTPTTAEYPEYHSEPHGTTECMPPEYATVDYT